MVVSWSRGYWASLSLACPEKNCTCFRPVKAKVKADGWEFGSRKNDSTRSCCWCGRIWRFGTHRGRDSPAMSQAPCNESLH